jgi:hypothetical protein
LNQLNTILHPDYSNQITHWINSTRCWILFSMLLESIPNSLHDYESYLLNVLQKRTRGTNQNKKKSFSYMSSCILIFIWTLSKHKRLNLPPIYSKLFNKIDSSRNWKQYTGWRATKILRDMRAIKLKCSLLHYLNKQER